MASFLALECRGGKVFLSGDEQQGRRPSAWFRSLDHGTGVGRSLRLKPPRQRAQAVLTVGPARGLGDIESCPSVSAGRRVVRKRAGEGAEKCEQKNRSSSSKEPDTISPERLDEWMSQSIAEIVRNIGEAPFLVHVFSSPGTTSGSASVILEREPAAAERWPGIRRRWHDDGRKPDGVILVEELKGEEGGRAEDGEASSSSSDSDGPCSGDIVPSSRTWGLVVQGRGADCAACYILNTCRVRSSMGFCTHFCLARAKCFGDTAETQLRKSWLQ